MPTEKKTNQIYYGWWIVLSAFCFAAYVAGTVFFGFSAFLDAIVIEFNWSYTEISLIAALRGLNMGIFAPVAGILVDRYGAKNVVVLGAITNGAGFLILSRTHTPATFIAAFLLVSLGSGGMTSVVLMSVVANWFRRHVGKAMGLVACGFGVGGALVPLNVWLVDTHGWRTGMVVLGLGMLLLGLPLASIIRNRPQDYGLLPDGDTRLPIQPLTEFSPQEKGDELRTGIRSRSFWFVTGSETVRMAVVSSVVMHVIPYLGSVGYSRHMAGLVAAGMPLMSIIGRIGFGWLGDIYPKRLVMIWALVSMLAGLFAYSYAGFWWATLLFLLFFGPGFGGNTTLRSVILREYFGTAAFGRLLGITMGLSSLGGIIGPAITGWVYDTYGAYDNVWIGFCLLSCLGVGLMYMAKPDTSQALEAQRLK